MWLAGSRGKVNLWHQMRAEVPKRQALEEPLNISWSNALIPHKRKQAQLEVTFLFVTELELEPSVPNTSNSVLRTVQSPLIAQKKRPSLTLSSLLQEVYHSSLPALPNIS